jgi:hypothetical protein
MTVRPLVALALALTLSGVVSCGKSAPTDRPMTPEKLREYAPIPAGMMKKAASKVDDAKGDFSVVYQDLQNDHGDLFKVMLRDYAEDDFGERFASSTGDAKWKKTRHRDHPARESGTTEKPAIEVMIKNRFMISVSAEPEKGRKVPHSQLYAVVDAVDLNALAEGKPPKPQAAPSAAAAPDSEPTPMWSPAPRPSGSPNALSQRIELALARVEDQAKESNAELMRLQKALKAAGRVGNRSLETAIANQKKKLEEIIKREAETRRDLERAFKEPPKPTETPKPTVPPKPTKPPEPTLREKWTKQVEPLLKEKGKGKDVLEIIQKLPIEERQSIEYHSALARASLDVQASEQAADALLMLGALTPDPRPKVAAVKAWTKGRADQQYKLAVMAMAAKNKDLKIASRAYLSAVRLDSGVLAQDDKGLRPICLKALRNTIEKQPDRADLYFKLAVYAHFVGEPVLALDSFRKGTALEQDPYLRWRNEAWIKKLQGGR